MRGRQRRDAARLFLGQSPRARAHAAEGDRAEARQAVGEFREITKYL